MKWTNPNLSKYLIERFYKICTIRNLSNCMGHLITSKQDNNPQTIIPLPLMVHVSHNNY